MIAAFNLRLTKCEAAYILDRNVICLGVHKLKISPQYSRCDSPPPLAIARACGGCLGMRACRPKVCARGCCLGNNIYIYIYRRGSPILFYVSGVTTMKHNLNKLCLAYPRVRDVSRHRATRVHTTSLYGCSCFNCLDP